MSDCDYVVVGSGAGGGTLAARLAEAGMRVVLLEAGGDPADEPAARAPGLPEDYLVPGFHPLGSENPAMSWKFFVRHYADGERQKADWKWRIDPDTGEPSVFYPRAGTLGGCTAHNAMIFLAPQDSDWDEIAAITGDDSWRVSNMRRYFRLLENCRHRPLWRFLNRFGRNETGHGWTGWLSTELALPRKAARDNQLAQLMIETSWAVARYSRLEQLTTYLERPWLATAWEWLQKVWKVAHFSWQGAAAKLAWPAWLPGLPEGVDPNDQRRLDKRGEGLCYVPLTTDRHRRTGTRERLKEVAARCPERLQIELNALATRVIFDSGNRAVGIEYLKGERLYRAHAEPSAEPGERREIRVAREVILAGGAFNTPQLLMLSGIGPRKALEQHNIQVVQELAGVGQNLQDRYEIGVVHKMARPWNSLIGAKFVKEDPLYQRWADRRGGMYISNGAAIAFTRRSAPQQLDPDLFCMALLASFKGYYPGYSAGVCDPLRLDYLTFAILKAHTINRAGSVTLRSSDPRERPDINFRYFEEGDDSKGKDLDAVVEGIQFVRKITAGMKRRGLIGEEELPGEHLRSAKELAQHVRATAWGHHASCTCPIGPRPEGGVLTSDFKVHGTHGLRIVDASVFPRIPGLFIASAVYMIAEKAADVILCEAKRCRGAP
ncbi:MAG: GMC family oxidoreductase [Methylocella sp.]